jgi:hypothetical protein
MTMMGAAEGSGAHSRSIAIFASKVVVEDNG